jgi:hypothetical protein
MSEELKLIEQILAHAEDEKTNRSWASDDVGWENVDAIWHKAEQLKKLLKEQEGRVQQWTKEIADYQLAHAPKDSHEFMSLSEHLENIYKRGIWDGLQIAWNIISEGR